MQLNALFLAFIQTLGSLPRGNVIGHEHQGVIEGIHFQIAAGNHPFPRLHAVDDLFDRLDFLLGRRRKRFIRLCPASAAFMIMKKRLALHGAGIVCHEEGQEDHFTAAQIFRFRRDDLTGNDNLISLFIQIHHVNRVTHNRSPQNDIRLFNLFILRRLDFLIHDQLLQRLLLLKLPAFPDFLNLFRPQFDRLTGHTDVTVKHIPGQPGNVPVHLLLDHIPWSKVIFKQQTQDISVELKPCILKKRNAGLIVPLDTAHNKRLVFFGIREKILCKCR